MGRRSFLEVTSVDAIGREELVGILTLDVRRGIAQTTTELLPRDDRTIDGTWTAESGMPHASRHYVPAT